MMKYYFSFHFILSSNMIKRSETNVNLPSGPGVCDPKPKMCVVARKEYIDLQAKKKTYQYESKGRSKM